MDCARKLIAVRRFGDVSGDRERVLPAIGGLGERVLVARVDDEGPAARVQFVCQGGSEAPRRTRDERNLHRASIHFGPFEG